MELNLVLEVGPKGVCSVDGIEPGFCIKAQSFFVFNKNVPELESLSFRNFEELS
jgi:hypothetical protein